MPRAWYCPQSQSENGDSRPSCQPNVRSQNVRAASSDVRLEQQHRERQRRADEERRRRSARRGRVFHSGYVAQSGATTSAANFVQPASAAKPPRSPGDAAKQNPQISNAGRIASFVFELDAYCVNGYAAHANGERRREPLAAEAPARRARGRATQRTSNASEVKCAAGRSSHLPVQPKSA